MPSKKSLPKDLVPIETYSARKGNYELNGLMYSPSEKALYNSAFLKKKINLKGKSGFYTYQKGDNGLDRKRIYVSVDRFLKQYPQYNDVFSENSDKSDNDKSIEKSYEKSDEKSISDKSDDNNSIEAKPRGRSPIEEKSVSENQLFDVLKNYK